MALALFGSDRVTFDTDLVVKRPLDLEESRSLVNAMYKAKCYYVSRLMIDKPDTLLFWNPDLEMRIDILLDFPFKASGLLASAVDKKLDETTGIKVASLRQLKKMKETALRARRNPKDAEDLEFIRKKIASLL